MGGRAQQRANQKRRWEKLRSQAWSFYSLRAGFPRRPCLLFPVYWLLRHLPGVLRSEKVPAGHGSVFTPHREQWKLGSKFQSPLPRVGSLSIYHCLVSSFQPGSTRWPRWPHSYALPFVVLRWSRVGRAPSSAPVIKSFITPIPREPCYWVTGKDTENWDFCHHTPKKS